MARSLGAEGGFDHVLARRCGARTSAIASGAVQTSVDAHGRDVATIAEQVRSLAGRGEPVHIDKGGVHHVVPLASDPRFRSRPVDISHLDRILSVDVAQQLCVAEPGVTFVDLVRTTLPHGLVPAVVPELKGITVGGAVAGCSIESASFRYGGFHDTAMEYEVVTGDGRVVTCSPESDPLAFGMIHGSYGTLGILTKLTFGLVPAKPYVRLEYRNTGRPEAFLEEMRAACDGGEWDFVDGIAHGPEQFVLCLGRYVDEVPYVSDYSWLDIYYKSTRERDEDFLTTPDYFFRYDTEAHWLTATIPPLQWKPVRFAVGKVVLGSTNLIKWSSRLRHVLRLKRRPEVVVDVFIPSRQMTEFAAWYERDYAFYPLWLVPYRVTQPYPWIAPEHWARMDDDLIIDCAVYGKKNTARDVDYSEVLEEKTYELGGIKTLISRNHYSRERFWSIYDEDNYRAAKASLDPEGVFPDLYEKFSRVE
jgi:FAD/FMN-containing dehydrogenase